MGGTLHLERRGALLLVHLAKGRGNAIDARLLKDLEAAAGEAAGKEEIRGLLLASSRPGLFCPGLDLVELAGLDRAELERLMLQFARVLRLLLALPKPLVVEVGGHAVAGGCLLALTGDHRILGAGARMGLSELKVGVPLPWTATELLRARLPPPALARIALLAHDLEGAEAVEAGLAQEVVPAASLRHTSLARLEELAARDRRAFAVTKTNLTAPVAASMAASEQERLDDFLDVVLSEPTRSRIREAASALSRRPDPGAPS